MFMHGDLKKNSIMFQKHPSYSEEHVSSSGAVDLVNDSRVKERWSEPQLHPRACRGWDSVSPTGNYGKTQYHVPETPKLFRRTRELIWGRGLSERQPCQRTLVRAPITPTCMSWVGLCFPYGKLWTKKLFPFVPYISLLTPFCLSPLTQQVAR